jgi:hypothetical protein
MRRTSGLNSGVFSQARFGRGGRSGSGGVVLAGRGSGGGSGRLCGRNRQPGGPRRHPSAAPGAPGALGQVTRPSLASPRPEVTQHAFPPPRSPLFEQLLGSIWALGRVWCTGVHTTLPEAPILPTNDRPTETGVTLRRQRGMCDEGKRQYQGSQRARPASAAGRAIRPGRTGRDAMRCDGMGWPPPRRPLPAAPGHVCPARLANHQPAPSSTPDSCRVLPGPAIVDRCYPPAGSNDPRSSADPSLLRKAQQTGRSDPVG